MTARRHHYIPQCYLKAFSVEKKSRQLYVFDFATRKSFQTAIQNVAVVRDFNRVAIDGHPPDAIESALAQFEGKASLALERTIASGKIGDESDHVLILNLIGLLFLRNPRLRESFREFSERVAKRTLDLALSKPEIWASQVKKIHEARFIGKDTDLDYNRMKAFHTEGDYKIDVPTEEHIRIEFKIFDEILPLLFQRGWVILKAPHDSPGFITCDHPVALTWSEPKRAPIGLALKGTEILFALSPKLALIGAFELEHGEFEVKEEMVAEFNGTMIATAERQVYSRDMNFKYLFGSDSTFRKASRLLNDPRFRRAKDNFAAKQEHSEGF